MVRAGFQTILDAQPDVEVVGEAADGAEAVAVVQRLIPDVVLMDIRMPRMDGLEATRLLAGPGVADPRRVIILTTSISTSTCTRRCRPGPAASCSKTPAATTWSG